MSGGRSAVLGVLFVAAACYSDRSRPSPTESEQPVRLSVLLNAPLNGQAVYGDRTTTVSVEAVDLSGDQLHGVGFVARQVRNGNVPLTLDSVALRPDTTSRLLEQEFVFAVPDLPQNTEIDVFGIAYGPGTLARLSDPSAIIVVRCEPGMQGC